MATQQDDIVTRLRSGDTSLDTLEEAAWQIERFRRALEIIKERPKSAEAHRIAIQTYAGSFK